MADAHRAYLEGDLDGFYAPLVVDDTALDRGVADGRYAIDTRLRDRLRGLRSGPGAAAAFPGSLGARDVREAAAFAGEYSALGGGRHRPCARGACGPRRDADLGARARTADSDSRGTPGQADVSASWQRLLGFVPTRAAAVVLLVLALAVFWFEALGWPMAKGRDTWDYLVYYLQLADADPPISRAPALPNAHHAARTRATSRPRWQRAPGGRLRLPVRGHDPRLERHRAHVRAHSGALHCGTSARLPGVRHAVPPGVQRRSLRHRARTLGTPACAHHAVPVGWRFAALGAGIAALVLIRPANQVFLPLALVPLLLPVAWRQRIVWSGVCVGSARRTPRRLGAPQRRALRRRHRGTRRTGLGAVPHRVHGQPDDRPGERGSIPAACPPDRDRGACEGTACSLARTAGRVPRATVRTTRPYG